MKGSLSPVIETEAREEEPEDEEEEGEEEREVVILWRAGRGRFLSLQYIQH